MGTDMDTDMDTGKGTDMSIAGDNNGVVVMKILHHLNCSVDYEKGYGHGKLLGIFLKVEK